VIHFDEERIPDGKEIKDSAYQLSVASPYAPAKGTLDLVDTATVDGIGADLELGMKEFSCSFWYRPEWERGKSDQTIFDYGLDSDHTNRVYLRYEGKRDALILGVKDATREDPVAYTGATQHGCEVKYEFEHTTWTAKEWYHIACHVHGCGPGMLQLFVDGEQQ